jgi:hypothetical protein
MINGKFEEVRLVCPLPTAHCPLPTAHCLLPTAYCCYSCRLPLVLRVDQVIEFLRPILVEVLEDIVLLDSGFAISHA